MQQMDRISATVPMETANEMRRIADERHIPLSGLIAEICVEYIRRVRGTYCEVCRLQNLPGARFCSKCGRPISPEAIREVDEAIAAARDSPEFRAAIAAILKKDP